MKYIIDIEKEPYLQESDPFFDSGLYRASNFKSLVFDQNGLAKLTPYTEPGLNPLVDEAVETIENEVWEFVRTCLVMDGSDFTEAFDSCSYINLLEYSYQEAKAKFEAWLKQKDELNFGDEIISVEDDVKAVMLDCADYESIYVWL